MFGVGESTVSLCLKEFISAVNMNPKNLYLAFPTKEDDRNIAACFEYDYSWPCAFGALDGFHVPIRPMKDQRDSLHN